MSQKQITKVGDSAAVLLNQELLDSLGAKIGDEIDVSVEGRKLILTPIRELEREQKIKFATKDIFERRSKAYKQLAEGEDPKEE